ncbi:hypothetical protein SCUCBS95973_001302 [Sporothrix curviconia]|uniref:Protein kinase domain-containing protein n=1 Tax=Sporothrix curviconia TaxID=1260050 RepID=A0ABP0AXG2_9PEZI
MEVFPDWPRSDADLVPLPRVEGPKLKAFDFGGEQQIEFLDYLGSGVHGHVLRVKIHGRDDPFYNECRAFGRLQETGQAHLAIACHGYVLLDETHERALQDKFPLDIESRDNMLRFPAVRSCYPGPSGKPQPIRALVKDLGQPDDTIQDLPRPIVSRILDNIIALHKLGITGLDLKRGQLIDWKPYDMSCASTTPHFFTDACLRPATLPPVAEFAVELNLFHICSTDYLELELLQKYSNKNPLQKHRLNLYPIHGREKYKLRGNQYRPFTLVDPRDFDWRSITYGSGAASNDPTSSMSAMGCQAKPTTGRVTRSLTASKAPKVSTVSKVSKTSKTSKAIGLSTTRPSTRSRSFQRVRDARLWWYFELAHS